METPQKQTPCIFNQPFNMSEFFSEPNSLDSLAGPVPCWNKDNYKNKCAIDTVAYLHVLQDSNLNTKNLIIFDTTCHNGDPSAFLAHEARRVHAFDENDKNLEYATKNNSIHNLKFIKKGNLHKNYYDLIVASTPHTVDIERLQQLRNLLVSHGEIFCTFVTRSNPLPIAANALREMFPKIKKSSDYLYQSRIQSFIDIEDKKYPTDETVKNMIDKAQFTIISYEQKSFDILILDKNEFKDLHTSVIMNSPFMQRIDDIKKREKIAKQFVDKIISKIKKYNFLKNGNFDYWFYPVNTTVVHIRKND